mmetsp:Transcript_25424/g.82234  ORF Transcript_25424/g.82234 Transcript_25424/m.82234 type:complete len:559 (-) Transcript_25424:41-1717(-)
MDGRGALLDNRQNPHPLSPTSPGGPCTSASHAPREMHPSFNFSLQRKGALSRSPRVGGSEEGVEGIGDGGDVDDAAILHGALLALDAAVLGADGDGDVGEHGGEGAGQFPGGNLQEALPWREPESPREGAAVEADDDAGPAPEGHLEGIGQALVEDLDADVEVGPPPLRRSHDVREVLQRPPAGILLLEPPPPPSRDVVCSRGEEDEAHVPRPSPVGRRRRAFWREGGVFDEAIDEGVDVGPQRGEDRRPESRLAVRRSPGDGSHARRRRQRQGKDGRQVLPPRNGPPEARDAPRRGQPRLPQDGSLEAAAVGLAPGRTAGAVVEPASEVHRRLLVYYPELAAVLVAGRAESRVEIRHVRNAVGGIRRRAPAVPAPSEIVEGVFQRSRRRGRRGRRVASFVDGDRRPGLAPAAALAEEPVEERRRRRCSLAIDLPGAGGSGWRLALFREGSADARRAALRRRPQVSHDAKGRRHPAHALDTAGGPLADDDAFAAPRPERRARRGVARRYPREHRRVGARVLTPQSFSACIRARRRLDLCQPRVGLVPRQPAEQSLEIR